MVMRKWEEPEVFTLGVEKTRTTDPIKVVNRNIGLYNIASSDEWDSSSDSDSDSNDNIPGPELS